MLGSDSNGLVSAKAKKLYVENYPLASILAQKRQRMKTLQKNLLVRNGQFWLWFLLWVAKIFKEYLKIVQEKSVVKCCIKKICYTPHPFSGKQHQNLFRNEIVPFFCEVQQFFTIMDLFYKN
jgi:hypothetical protein